MGICLWWFLLGSFLLPTSASAFEKGIYLTQSTVQHTSKVKKIIRQAKAAGINTFVIDVYHPNKRYARNIALIRKAGIRYVARVVVFPHGGTHAQVTSRKIWEKRWKRAKYAISLGASAIQLDYIRYKASQPASKKNAKYVLKVIQFFKNKLRGTKVKLQIDIFGIAAIRPSNTIGQDPKLFAPVVNTINPMVYPSHYEPYKLYAKQPYKTVLDSVVALRKQLKSFPHVRINAYIELYNYRYPMSRAQKYAIFERKFRAARDAGGNGFLCMECTK